MTDTSTSTKNASLNLFQAAQHAIGLTVTDIMKWLGLCLASAWFWTAEHANDSLLPTQTPLGWLSRTSGSFGWHLDWPTNVETWLGTHSGVFWVLLAAAAFASGRDRAVDAAPTASISLIALMLATSVHGVAPSAMLFAALTLCLAIAALLADTSATRTNSRDERVYASAEWTFGHWLLGPVALLVLVPLAPALLILAAIRDYRTPQLETSDWAFNLGSDAAELPTTPLRDVPANVVLPFIAEAMLYASTAEDRKSSISSLRRRMATGARRLQ